mmetsp:Transcript_1213/g.1330  ORF Transcript_1213/g.1330 Transcript_1213/m.1330 type:complete len:333 (+) Transcript_1213:19-1017(+)
MTVFVLLLVVTLLWFDTLAFVVNRHHFNARRSSKLSFDSSSVQKSSSSSSPLYQSGDNNSYDESQDVSSLGLNELQTLLRDAVDKEDFFDAAIFSDELFERLYGDENGGLSISLEEKKAKRKRMSWRGQGAAPWLVSRLDALNYTLPTTIQINTMEAVNRILSEDGINNEDDDDDDDDDDEDDESKACFSKMTRLSRLGVPTKSCISNRPGRIIATSKARKRLVAKKKILCFDRRKSLMAVNIAVVNILDSMDKFGFSRSKQNSSISSNRITHRLNDCNRVKTYWIREATFVNPSAKKQDVSMTKKSHPNFSATASVIVVFAVPGLPNNIVE